MILLDTSVLSLAFRRRRVGEPEPQVAATLRRLVTEDAPVGVPGIVLQSCFPVCEQPKNSTA
jgi:hypothetical protein